MNELKIENELTFICSRPGEGKTTLALKIANDFLDNGKSVFYFSFDATKDYLNKKVNNNKLTIYDEKISIEDIIDIIQKDIPDVVVLDYLQLIESKNKQVNNAISHDREVKPYIIENMKKLSKKLNITIIIISNLGRDCNFNIAEDNILFIHNREDKKVITIYKNQNIINEIEYIKYL